MRMATRGALLALAAAALLLPTGAGAVPQAQTAPTIGVRETRRLLGVASMAATALGSSLGPTVKFDPWL